MDIRGFIYFESEHTVSKKRDQKSKDLRYKRFLSFFFVNHSARMLVVNICPSLSLCFLDLTQI